MTQKVNLLITGGAGFIGSNLVEHFLEDDRVALVRILDDLSNGYYENIREFEDHSKFEFIKGDITDYPTCQEAMQGIHKVSHQAALGSVPRSIENPMRTNEVNVAAQSTSSMLPKKLAWNASSSPFHPAPMETVRNCPKWKGKRGIRSPLMQ